MLVFSFVESLVARYLERFLSGMFAAAVTPGAAGGLLFNVGSLPGISFILTAGLVTVGFLVSLGLARMLVLPNSSLLSSSERELKHSKNS